jgi:membrane protease subunit (stomatin/prohibitin family)
MAIIDLVTHSFAPEEYAHKFPNSELSTWTQLVVHESQEAYLFKEGRMVGPFRAGRYTLDTANFPFLSSLMKIPFGGRSPFTAEVWFVNRTMPLDVKWGTQDPIQLEDPKYSVMLPVRAFGQYGVQIDNASKFLLKLVGTVPTFDRLHLTSYFRGLILTRAKSAVAQYIVRQEVSILKIAAHLNEISDLLKSQMEPELAEFGLKLVNFFVSSINTEESDPAVAQLKAALAKRAEMAIIGYTYQQERSFDTMQTAAGNPGGGQSGLMGAGIGLGLGVGMGSAVVPAMAQITNSL